LIDSSEEMDVWACIDADDLWALDKLILAKKTGHSCGPVGMPVPNPGTYIVRPCVNPLGLGLGTQRIHIDHDTSHLTPGHFWCEEFDGPHISMDYHWGEPSLCVQGFKPHDEFLRWSRWTKTDQHIIYLPKILQQFAKKYEWINCEFIGGKLIEVHFRRNPNFDYGNSDFIPVWHDSDDISSRMNLSMWRYIECPAMHGRIGAYIK
jgi:hypothetical protein